MTDEYAAYMNNLKEEEKKEAEEKKNEIIAANFEQLNGCFHGNGTWV